MIFLATCAYNLNAEKFTLATWNILAEWAYLQNVKTKAMPFDTTTDSEGREVLLWENLKKLSKKGVDIICLQEVDMRLQAAGPDIVMLLENAGYTVVKPKKISSQATLVAYNKKFKGSNNYEITLTNKSGGGKKQCSTVTLSSVKNPSFPSVKIISLHAPFELGFTEQDALDNLQNNVLSHANKLGFTIVCGDFNYTTYSSNPKYSILSYNNLVDAHHFFAKFWNDAGLQHGFNKTGTAYSQAFKRMDYIFYTTTYQKNTLNCIKYKQIPDDVTRLIKHTIPAKGEGGSFSDFPSDHAILLAEFQLKDTSKVKKHPKKDVVTKLGQSLKSLFV